MLIHDDCQFHHVCELLPHGNSGLQLQRFPQRVFNHLDHPTGRRIAQKAIGCEIRLVTSSPVVAPIFGAPEDELTVVVYRGQVEVAQHLIQPGTIRTIRCETPESFASVDQHCLGGPFDPAVWRFQIWGNATWHGIGTYGHERRPPTPAELPRRRYLAHGSSITMGSWSTYVMQTARRIGADVWNYGMGGSCLCEPVMADFLANHGKAFDVISLELGVNMRGSYSSEEFAERAGSLLDRVACGHPDTPIAVITIFPNAEHHRKDGPSVAGRNQDAYDDILRQWVARNRHRRVPVELIEGREILTDVTGHRGDLLHPGLWASIEMGERLAARSGARRRCIRDDVQSWASAPY